jgi:hypothetical protein
VKEVITMSTMKRNAPGALARPAGILAGLLALIVLAAPPSSAATAHGPGADRVGFAMRGPLKTGADQRLVFQVHAPAGEAPQGVLVHLAMPAMAMHERTLRARALGHGRYAVHAPLSMAGRWVAHVTLTRDGASVTRTLPFRTIDGPTAPWRLLGAAAALLALAGVLTYRTRRRPSAATAAGERHA